MIRKKIFCFLVMFVFLFCKSNKCYAAESAIIGGGGVVVTICAEEVIAYLLGAVGLASASAAVYSNREALIDWGSKRLDDFKDFCSDVGQTAVDVGNWIGKVGSGVLDKTSDVWSSFKSWVSGIYSSFSGGSDVGDIQILPPASVVRLDGNETYFCYGPGSGGHGGHRLYAGNGFFDFFCLYYDASERGYENCFGIIEVYSSTYSDTTVHVDRTGNAWSLKYVSANGIYYNYNWYYVSRDSFAAHYISNATWSSGKQKYWKEVIPQKIVFDEYGDARRLCESYLDGTYSLPLPSEIGYWDMIGHVGDIYSRDGDIGAIDFINPGYLLDDDEVQIDWGGIAVGGSISDAIIDVGVGDRSIDDVIEKSKVRVIDKTTSKTIEENPQDVSEISLVITTDLPKYRLKGLERIFPFCLPFDMIDFFSCLCAKPEAPVFNLPFPTIDSKGNFKVTTFKIDLNCLNPMMQVLRDAECFAFILGLIKITRSKMIRG